MTVRIFFILLLSVFFTGKAVGKPNQKSAMNDEMGIPPAIISVQLESKAEFILNYIDNYGTHIKYHNSSATSTTVKKVVSLTKPTIFTYVVDPFSNNFKYLLILPGDSIVLSNNGGMVAFSTSIPDYIENIIEVPPMFSQYNPVLIKEFNKGGPQSTIKAIQKTFVENKQRIGSLRLNQHLLSLLNNFNDHIKFALFSYVDLRAFSLQDSVILNNVSDEIISNMGYLNSINGQSNSDFIRYLINWHFLSYNKRLIKDFWLDINFVSDAVSSSDFYYSYLMNWIQNLFVANFNELTKVNSTLKGILNPNPTIKKVIFFSDILIRSMSDFAGSRQEIKDFEGGKYLYLLENHDGIVHEMKNINSLNSVALVSVMNIHTDLHTILGDGKSIYLIDFWASWCKPCIEDYPYLVRAKDKFKDKAIKFVSISIDSEETKTSWLKTLKQLDGYHEPNHFLLSNAKDSQLVKFFHLKTIPRYVLIDSRGSIINPDFLRPSADNFSLELEKILERNNSRQ